MQETTQRIILIIPVAWIKTAWLVIAESLDQEILVPDVRRAKVIISCQKNISSKQMIQHWPRGNKL